MLDFVHRSRSLRRGQGRKPGSHNSANDKPGDDGRLVSSEKWFKQDPGSGQNQAMPSASEGALSDSGPPRTSPLSPGRSRRPTPSPTSSIMPERPNTSSGPGSSSRLATANDFKDFDKRKSKDDLALQTRGSPYGLAHGGYKSYHIPIRGKPPSPKDGARDFSPPRTVPVRTLTPESINDGNGNGIITIGMAIGSPGHPPPEIRDPPQNPRATPPMTTAPSDLLPRPSPAASATEQPQPQKTGRWRLFGRSKSKRVKPEPPAPVPPTANADPVVATPTDGGLDRSNTDRRNPRHKPIIIRSQTEPVADGHRDAKEPRPTVEQKPSRPMPRLAPPPASSFQGNNDNSAGPLLNVEIPDITMERYSVMFGGLIQSNRNNSSSSALLARRQATLGQLKTISDKVEQEEQHKDRKRGRRATSPNPVDSPSLSLFPTPPSINVERTPSPLSARVRSSTAPVGLPAHPKERVAENKRKTQALTLKNLDAKTYEPSQKPATTDTQRSLRTNNRPRIVTDSPSRFSPDQSSLILDSPTEAEPPPQTHHIRDQIRPKFVEPEWEMVSSASAGGAPASATTSPLKSRKPSVPASGPSTAPIRTTSLPSPNHDVSPTAGPTSTPSITSTAKRPSDASTDDQALNAAVEISIARQISISQQQRSMLAKSVGGGGAAGVRRVRNRERNREREPSAAGSSSPATATSGTHSPVPAKLASNERLASTKKATPTLVTPGEPREDSPLAQHRKSSQVVLEG